MAVDATWNNKEVLHLPHARWGIKLTKYLRVYQIIEHFGNTHLQRKKAENNWVKTLCLTVQ